MKVFLQQNSHTLFGRFSLVVRLALAVCFVFFCAALAIVKPAGSPGPEPHRAVLVELFTSEGCSSCPPADELLGHLRQDLAAQHIEVIPLGFHVDYWNSLGWKDRFSSADFSHRQEQYARWLHLEGPYTPQLVVNGEREFVGSNAGRARSTIAEAAGGEQRMQIKASISNADKLNIEITSPGTETSNVFLAVTEDNLATKVGAGENNGRVLRHAAVVRQLQQLGELQHGKFQAGIPFNFQKDWKRDDLRAVVFVQDRSSGRVQAAASVPVVDHLR